jgi:ADP-ribose pyrophosphatase YjhB (NUDIX family)
MADKLISADRERIFSLFAFNRELKFGMIEKELGISSNQLSYHLSKMVEEGILVKTGDAYTLTHIGESMIPALNQITGREQGLITIVAAAVMRGDRICLLKRKKRPYQGYWSLPGGKMRLQESLKDAAIREVREETGLDCHFDDLCSVVHERVRDGGVFKHAFVIFFCRLNANGSVLQTSDEGDIAWFDVSELPEKIIPSDRLMIEKLLNGSLTCKEVLMDDSEGTLSRFRVAEAGTF